MCGTHIQGATGGYKEAGINARTALPRALGKRPCCPHCRWQEYHCSGYCHIGLVWQGNDHGAVPADMGAAGADRSSSEHLQVATWGSCQHTAR